MFWRKKPNKEPREKSASEETDQKRQSRRKFFRVMADGAAVIGGAAAAAHFIDKMTAQEKKFEKARKEKVKSELPESKMCTGVSLCTGYPPEDYHLHTQCYMTTHSYDVTYQISPEDSPFFNMVRKSPRKWNP